MSCSKHSQWTHDAADCPFCTINELMGLTLEQLKQEFTNVQQERDNLLTELATLRTKEPPLLQCIDCKNTESCAGAMARHFNHGRCMHCGGYFKVVRA